MKTHYISTEEYKKLEKINKLIFEIEKTYERNSPERNHLFQARCDIGSFENIRRNQTEK